MSRESFEAQFRHSWYGVLAIDWGFARGARSRPVSPKRAHDLRICFVGGADICKRDEGVVVWWKNSKTY